MAETIIIDVKTNYTDNMSPAIEAAGRAMDRLEQSFRRMDKMMGSMRGNKAFDSLAGNGKFMASFDVKDNASKQMDSIMAGVKRLSGISTIRFAVDIIDHVTQPLQNIMSTVMNAGENLGRMVLQKGWARVTELDAAKAKLSGLGNTAADIQEISKNASDAVTGTAYSLNEAVTAAASAVAAGMKPGEQLKQYLTDIADVAGISGRSMGEIGSIMNAVVTTGKAQNDTLQRFAERGLPIYQWLAKTLNTTEDQISSMAKAGEIGIESLQAAIQTNIAGAAQEMGDKTILGVMANINAAYAKLGEAIIGASDDQKSLAGQAHEFLLEYKTDVNKLKAPLTELGRSMADVVAQFRPQAIELMNKGFDLMKDRLEALNTAIKSPEFQNADLFGKLKIAWDTVIGDPFSQWWDSSGHQMVIDKVTSLGEGIGEGLSTILKGLFGWNAGGGDIVGQATSVGAGFAQGFLAGFDGSGVVDAIADSFARALSNVFSSLVGGNSAGSGLLNALFLGMGAKGLLFGGLKVGGAIGGIERLFGRGEYAMGLGSMPTIAGGFYGIGRGGAVMASTGNGMLDAEVQAAGVNGASAGQILGGIAGFATAGVAIAGGVKDLVEAQEKETLMEQRATRTSGVTRFTGVGAGAAAGAAIGSIIPGLGTLVGAGVGAGVGGLMGLFAGNAIKRNAENANKSLERLTKGTKEYAQATEYAQKHMATLSLTTDEVNGVVSSVFGSGNMFERGVNQIQSAKTIASQVEATSSSIHGMNLQMESGIGLTEEQQQNYISGLLETADNAVTGITERGTAQAEIFSKFDKEKYEDFMDYFGEAKKTAEENQKAIHGFVEQFQKGELTMEQLKEKADPYLTDSENLVKEFTGQDETTQMGVAATVAKGVNLTADSLEEVSKGLEEKYSGWEETNGSLLNDTLYTLAQMYGGSPEDYEAEAQKAMNKTLLSNVGKATEVLDTLNKNITGTFGGDLDNYINSINWGDAMVNGADSLGDAALELSTLLGLTSAETAASIKNGVNRDDPKNKAFFSAIQEFAPSIEGAVNRTGEQIVQLSKQGLAVPESMMSAFETGVAILAAAGSESAHAQEYAIQLANDALDTASETSEQSNEAIKQILDPNKNFFSDAAVEQMVSDALSKTRYGKEIQQGNYENVAEAPDHGLVSFRKTGEGAGAPGETYTVEQGDGWYAVWRKSHGGQEATQEDLENLYNLNPDLVQNGLNPGDVVKISEGLGTAAEASEQIGEDLTEGGHGLVSFKKVGEEGLTRSENGKISFKKWPGPKQDHLEESQQRAKQMARDREQLNLARQEAKLRTTIAQAEEISRGAQNQAPSTAGLIAEGVKTFLPEAANIGLGMLGNALSLGFGPMSANAAEAEEVTSIEPTPGSGAKYDVNREARIEMAGPGYSGMNLNWPSFFNKNLAPNETLPLSKGTKEVPSDLFSTPDYSGGNQFQAPTATSPEELPHYRPEDQAILVQSYEGVTTAADGLSSGLDAAASAVDGFSSGLEAETPEIEATVEAEPSTKVGSADAMAESAQGAIDGVSIDANSLQSQAASAIGGALGSGGEAGAQEGAAATQSAISGAMAGLTVPATVVSAPVTIQPDVHVNPVTTTIGATSGGTGSTTVTVGGIAQNAAGGLIGSAELSWLAEEGYPEMVIPFAPHRRSRALELLAQAEDALGVTKHANGGVVGGMLPSGGDGESGSDSGSSKNSGSVQVGGINFTINTSGGGDIVSEIQGRSAEITEIVTNALADALEQAYENTPLAAG